MIDAHNHTKKQTVNLH